MNKWFRRQISRNQLPHELQSIGRHLVYSEGTKTEPKYIDNIKRLIAKKYQVNHNSIEIIIANEESTNTIYLVEMAKNDVRNRLKNDEKIDHIWIFFDKDDFPIKNYNKANATIHKLNDSSKKMTRDFIMIQKEILFGILVILMRHLNYGFVYILIWLNQLFLEMNWLKN